MRMLGWVGWERYVFCLALLRKSPGSFSSVFYAFSMHFNGKVLRKSPGSFSPLFPLCLVFFHFGGVFMLLCVFAWPMRVFGKEPGLFLNVFPMHFNVFKCI